MNTQARDQMKKQKVMHKLLSEIRMVLDRANIICEEHHSANGYTCMKDCPFDVYPEESGCCLLEVLINDAKLHDH